MSTDNTSTKAALRTLFFIYAALDVVWAALIATFASIVVSQGLSVTGAGTASVAAVGGIGGWLLAFGAGLFQGAIFLVVFSVFAALIIGGAAYVSKNDPKLRRFLEKHVIKPEVLLGVIYVVIDLLWAFVASTFYSDLIFHIGSLAGAGTHAWIISFIAAAAQGAIFLVVFSVFALMALKIGALLFGGKKSS